LLANDLCKHPENIWWFDPELNNGIAQRAFATLEQVFALVGKPITTSPTSEVARVEHEGIAYYVKRYAENGRFWWGSFLRYRIVKDLACLDKVAKYCLTHTQRLRFYLTYAGHSRLNKADKQRIRRVIDFFRGRE